MGAVSRLGNFISWLYLRYTLLTAVYMLEPMERWTCNFIVVMIIATSAYTTYVYLPSHCTMILSYLGILELEEGTERT